MAGLLIGDVAERAGVSAPTIRYYEQVGLLPAPVRSASGYRRYSDVAVDELRFIHKAQALGFSLDEITEILKLSRSGKTPCSRVLSLAHQHLAAVAERIHTFRSFTIRAGTREVGRAEHADVRRAVPDYRDVRADRRVERRSVAESASASARASEGTTMIARQGVDIVGASIIGAVAGFVTRPCCIGPAILSLAGASSAGLGAILTTYHMLFVSLGAVMLIASMWITFRRDGGWFNKMLTVSAAVIAFSWSMGRMGVL